MAPLMSLKGLNFSNSEIELYEDRLTVKHFMLPRREIPAKGIARIWYASKPGLIGPGVMNVSYRDDKGNFKTVEVYYNHGGAADIEKLRTTLEGMRNGGRPGTGQSTVKAPPTPATPAAPPAASNISEIEKLAELKAKGIITENEFEAKKHQLLFGDKGEPVLREKEIVREIVKVPCAYCGVLMKITHSKCPSCGAPINRR